MSGFWARYMAEILYCTFIYTKAGKIPLHPHPFSKCKDSDYFWDSVWLTPHLKLFCPETAYRVWGADSSEHMVRKT